jgi:hypothetical protein
MAGQALDATASGRGTAADRSLTLLRVAGYGAMGAIATLVVAGVALGIFFSDTEAFAVFGPINDVTTAVTLGLMLPAVAVLPRLIRGGDVKWYRYLSAITIGGMVVAAAGLLLLVVRVIDLQGSFVIGGLGMLPFLGWVAVTGYLALRGRLLSRTLGWWIAAFLGLTTASIAAAPFVPMALLTFTLFPPLAVALGGWLYVLGRDLLREAKASSPTG